MALQAPIGRVTHQVLRAAVLELIESKPRRRFPAVIHAGVPGRSVQHEEPKDSTRDSGPTSR